ncbi:MAG: hypothetical protein J5709_05750, partial [Bacteroidales bacterium]|nr:hypothetical protein [Bacteroidales bacterium]
RPRQRKGSIIPLILHTKGIAGKQNEKRSETSFLFFCKDARGSARDMQSYYHNKKGCNSSLFPFMYF